LALRIATVAPPATALELTDRFPREAGALGARIHAAALARAGRTAAAESVLVASGMHWSAIELRIERGDTSDLTELLALALRGAPPPLSLDRSILRRLATESDSLALLSSRSLLRSEEYGLALELSAYVIERDSTAAGAQLIAGVSLEHLDRRAEALTAYAAATVPEARFRHARLLLRLRRYSEALAELLAFANETGEPSLAPAALELVADRHEAAGQLHAADSLRRVIADRYPGTVFGSHARVALARAGLRSGEDAVALAWLGREVAERGAARHEAMFEIGTILERVRDSVAADSVYRLLARSDSLGYWGLRARAAADLPLPVFAPPIRMPRSSRTATLFDQLDFLSSAGLENEFQALYDFISSGAEFDPVELTVVAEELIERGRTSDAIRLGWQASRQLGLNDIRVIRVVFPWPRRELIEAEAAEWGVDPFLVAAIIRQESAFEANATSRAGARGMMQLMPATARWRAQRMGHRWQDSFLGVPDANLHVGMAHLVALLNQYDELVHALAAYNAGGGNLARWRRNRESPSDPDLFVDFIPFPETREYVKAVRRNLDLYRALYPYRS
ncbi:MAG: transglycosylase SLT domain-containing protein, partial [Gemmatimonadales bacterium]